MKDSLKNRVNFVFDNKILRQIIIKKWVELRICEYKIEPNCDFRW